MYVVDIDTSGVWIIVPAFDEATVIGEVVADLRSVFAHVVCVDDGSSDETGEVALRAGAHVVPHPVNLGQGAAIQTGVEYARRQPGAQIVVILEIKRGIGLPPAAIDVRKLTARHITAH